MNLEPGAAAAAVAAVLFYFRLIRVQRRDAGGSAGQPGGAPPRLVRRWGLFGVGFALVVAGALVAAGMLSSGLFAVDRRWWWIPVTVGFGALTLSL